MAVSFVAASAVVTGTAPTVAVPAGYTSGDLLIIVTVGATTADTPAGWTLLSAENLDQFFTIVYKLAAASESSVVLNNLGVTGKAVMVAYRGASGVFEVLPSYVKVTGTSVATPTLTTTVANDTILSLYATGTGGGTFTPDAATTSRVNSPTSGGFKGILLADETQASIGITTARTAIQSVSAAFVSFAIAIRPGTSKTVFITSGATYTLPSDWAAPWSIEVIGGGGGPNITASGNGGAGGGAYSKITNSDTTLSASSLVYIAVGSGGTGNQNGGDTWVNAVSNAAPTLTSQGVLAKGGSYSATTTAGPGGAAASGVGSTKTSGGSGAAGVASTNQSGGGAGGPSADGSAAGVSINPGAQGGGGAPNGLGVGGNATSTTGGVGGGPNGGTGATSSTDAGNGGLNSGGGGGGGVALGSKSGGDGGTGNIWTQTSNSLLAGPGGGGGAGGTAAAKSGSGGLYGGGAGSKSTGGSPGFGAQGIIVLTYNSASIPTNIFLAARLFSTGILAINNTLQFDEISTSTARISTSGVYASLFDEVSQTAVPMRILNNNSLQVSGSFDEVTGIL